MTECCAKYGNTQHFQYKRHSGCKRYYGYFDLIERSDKFEIWSLGIDRRYRNKGNATRMLTEFLSQFKEDKPLVLYVYKTNEIAIKLYEKVGFTIVGDCDFTPAAYTMQYKAERK